MTKPKPGEHGFVAPGGITCRQCTDFLLDYVEGTLPQDQLRAFEEHTHACEPCEIYLKNYKRVTEMAAKASTEPRPDEPEQVPARIIEAILRARTHAHRSTGDTGSHSG